MVKKFIVMVVIVLIVGCALLRKTEFANVTVLNESENTIAEGSILVCRQTLIFENIKPGKRRQLQYELGSDSDYGVKIRFDSGKEIEKSVGYVTNGLTVNDEIIITGESIGIR